MSSVSTEEFPYTTAYVTQLLGVDEAELMTFVRTLALAPKVDGQTNHLIFNHSDTEKLRKAVEMTRRGEEMTAIAQHFNVPLKTPEAGHLVEHPVETVTMPAATFGNRMAQQASAVNTPALTTPNGGNLAVVVEAVSSAKEGILNDMSRLLDDKLAGLDEVVVELIRCKSENDSLKQKNNLLSSEKEALQAEISRFTSTGFGFYRKD